MLAAFRSARDRLIAGVVRPSESPVFPLAHVDQTEARNAAALPRTSSIRPQGRYRGGHAASCSAGMSVSWP
jgi:hypothetical protein